MTAVFIVIHIVISIWLMWSFVKGDRGNPEPIWAIVTVAALGILSTVLAMIGNELFSSHYFALAEAGGAWSPAWSGAWRVGVVEEGVKILPVLVFIYRRRFFDEHADGVIYFGIAGLAFGLVENIIYSSGGGSAGLARLIFTPFFHGATTSLAGYFIARTKLRTGSIWRALMAIVAMILLHGLYDASLTSAVLYPWLLLVALAISVSTTVGVFFVYCHARRADYRLGLARAGVRKFCRACGAPNPKETLYCPRCGQRA